VLEPSPHVTDSRTLNPVLRTCLILFFWFFIVFPNKLWWRVHYFKNYFVRRSRRDPSCDRQVCLEISNGSRLILKHVKHVPDVWLNLFFVGMLCDENYKSSFSSDSWKLTKGSMVMGRGTKHSTLYIT